ncbi:MarR family protein [Stackebrandtia endophytica]|uniref:MarR family protein n=1 Tax=Stackebrandtia endophytica TaxID=1496996 RepID=A0A543B0E7_9ACTN|nr:MarR family winged helix-turn-helix transcriptional regulator [Stackebrandtia endophytica]TQL78230.1 MarR family protein [Stackebrandtia endophytica]
MSELTPPDYAITVERAMSRIRRSQSRRALAKLAEHSDPAILEAVDAVAALTEAGETASVGLVAERLDLDQPRASRLVTRAVDQGLLHREVDEIDRRRRPLWVTEAGHRRLDRARRFRAERFASAMADWSEPDQIEFARLLTRFTTDYTRGTHVDSRTSGKKET